MSLMFTPSESMLKKEVCRLLLGSPDGAQSDLSVKPDMVEILLYFFIEILQRFFFERFIGAIQE